MYFETLHGEIQYKLFLAYPQTLYQCIGHSPPQRLFNLDYMTFPTILRCAGDDGQDEI